MSGELRTQGTEVWVANGPTTILKIGNNIGLGDFGKQSNDLITTNLDSVAVEKIPGLPDNGDVTITINLNPDDESHQFLELNAGTANRFQFCVGFSDGTEPPTALASEIVPPDAADRTSQTFLAGIKSFRASVGIDAIVTAVVMLSISGGITTVWKETP